MNNLRRSRRACTKDVPRNFSKVKSKCSEKYEFMSAGETDVKGECRNILIVIRAGRVGPTSRGLAPYMFMRIKMFGYRFVFYFIDFMINRYSLM